jgi:hypothetical protein
MTHLELEALILGHDKRNACAAVVLVTVELACHCLGDREESRNMAKNLRRFKATALTFFFTSLLRVIC